MEKTQHVIGNSRVHFMDCIEGMKHFPDNHFDFACVDIPYGIGADKPTKKTGIVRQKNGGVLKVKLPDYGHKNWDTLPSEEYFEQLFRVSKNQMVFGGNYAGLAGGYLVWDKLNGESDQYGCELAWHSFSNRTDIVYFMWAGMMQGMYCGTDIRKALVQQGNKQLNEKRIHETQKPVALYDWIFQNYTKEGDRILDTHVGSQSSRIAADKHGLDFTGFETHPTHFENGNKRFNEYKSQMRLF